MSRYTELQQRISVLDVARESEARGAKVLLDALALAVTRELGAGADRRLVEYSPIEVPNRLAHRRAELSVYRTILSITVDGDDAEPATFAFDLALTGGHDPATPAVEFGVGFGRGGPHVMTNANEPEEVREVARSLVHACLDALGAGDGRQPVAAPTIR